MSIIAMMMSLNISNRCKILFDDLRLDFNAINMVFMYKRPREFKAYFWPHILVKKK